MTGTHSLTALFASGLRPEIARHVEPSAALEVALAGAIEAGRRMWPDLDVPADVFLPHLASRLDDAAWEPALATLHVGALYLTAGCSAGLRPALDVFERTFFGDVESMLRRSRIVSLDADDVRQMVRAKLFVAGEEGAQKIASYGGRGDLQGWFRVVVTRLVLNAVKQAPKDGPAKAAEDRELFEIAASASTELDYIRARYAEDLRAVFPEAFERLTVAARVLLRQRHLDGLGLDEIAALHGVHRATVSRQLSTAREALTDALRGLLKARLGLNTAEFESILRLLRSGFHITVRRMLQADPPAGGEDS